MLIYANLCKYHRQMRLRLRLLRPHVPCVRGLALHAARARLLGLEQPPVRVYLELERGLVVHELVVVVHELLEAVAHLADVAVALVEREAVLAPHRVQLLLQLAQPVAQVGVDLLEAHVLLLRVAERRLQVVRRLRLRVQRLQRLALSRLLRDLLRLDLVPGAHNTNQRSVWASDYMASFFKLMSHFFLFESKSLFMVCFVFLLL